MNKHKAFLIVMIFFTLMISCTGTNKCNTTNIFYINYICKNDTLLTILKNSTYGKVAYFNNEGKLQIVSLNYITEDHPNTHYFKVNEELPVKPEINSIKYEIIFNDSMINDSIAYSLKKYIYSGKGWQNKADMGFIKVFNNPPARDKNLWVIKEKVATSVLKTIVAKTYTN